MERQNSPKFQEHKEDWLSSFIQAFTSAGMWPSDDASATSAVNSLSIALNLRLTARNGASKSTSIKPSWNTKIMSDNKYPGAHVHVYTLHKEENNSINA